MGGWQLEVVRMAVYVFIPVGAFYLFHQVDLFEDRLEAFTRKVNTRYSIEQDKMIKEAIQINRRRRDAEYQAQLDEFNKKGGQ